VTNLPLTLADARSAVEARLAGKHEDLGGLVIWKVEVFVHGWVFYYKTRRLLETGDPMYALVGAARFSWTDETARCVNSRVGDPCMSPSRST
jgi:hypothetical protein